MGVSRRSDSGEKLDPRCLCGSGVRTVVAGTEPVEQAIDITLGNVGLMHSRQWARCSPEPTLGGHNDGHSRSYACGIRAAALHRRDGTQKAALNHGSGPGGPDLKTRTHPTMDFEGLPVVHSHSRRRESSACLQTCDEVMGERRNRRRAANNADDGARPHLHG